MTDRTDEIRDDRRDDLREDAPRDRARDEARDEQDTARPDSVLGLGDANPPRDPVPSEGRPIKGIELETERPGMREVKRGSGATGIDMGAGGEGTDVDRET
jgi:hypothetical protein